MHVSEEWKRIREYFRARSAKQFAEQRELEERMAILFRNDETAGQLVLPGSAIYGSEDAGEYTSYDLAATKPITTDLTEGAN